MQVGDQHEQKVVSELSVVYSHAHKYCISHCKMNSCFDWSFFPKHNFDRVANCL